MTTRRTFLVTCVSLVASCSLASEVDDTDSISEAIAKAGVGQAVYFPPGTYRVGRTIVIKAGVPVVANDCVFETSGDYPVFQLEGGSSVALCGSKQVIA
jgi:hypothetical protein